MVIGLKKFSLLNLSLIIFLCFLFYYCPSDLNSRVFWVILVSNFSCVSYHNRFHFYVLTPVKQNDKCFDYKDKRLQNTGKGTEDHAAFTSDKKNDFNVPMPPSSQISFCQGHQSMCVTDMAGVVKLLGCYTAVESI